MTTLARIQDVCWALPVFVVAVTGLWAYTAWFRRASEALAFRWAEENGLKFLWLTRTRMLWRRPPGVWFTRGDELFRFAARAADGQVVGGWVVVSTTPWSLRPDRIRVTFEGKDENV